ncbi:hypothetical protein UlMin_008783 [Ulmus minor]
MASRSLFASSSRAAGSYLRNSAPRRGFLKEGLKYTKTHEWVNVDQNLATFGVTDYAFAHFRFLDYFWIPEVGTSATQGKKIKRADTFFYMKSGMRYKNILAPVSGKIVQVNDDVKESHRTSSDGTDYKFFYPYEDGWMVKIEMSDPSEVDELMDSDQYSKFIEDKDAAKATLYNL